jgi:cytochrome c-type biogenesis protein CcmF
VIAEAGLAALWLAAAMALLQLALGALGLTKRYEGLMTGVPAVAVAQMALVATAFACLSIAGRQ